MSEPEDPTPWKHAASGAPDGFAELVHSDAQTGPTGAELTRIIERLALQVSAPELAHAFRSGPGTAHQPAAQTALRATSGARLGLLAKVIAGACALGAIALGLLKLDATHRTEAARPATHVVARVPASSQLEVPAAAVPAGDGAAPQVATPHASVAAAQPTPRVPDAAGELRLLESAQQALRDDPARALALAEQHRQRFARGEFAQEREMLAIEALVALGQSERAAARARAFARHYPGSTHLPHLRDLVHATP